MKHLQEITDHIRKFADHQREALDHLCKLADLIEQDPNETRVTVTAADLEREREREREGEPELFKQSAASRPHCKKLRFINHSARASELADLKPLRTIRENVKKFGVIMSTTELKTLFESWGYKVTSQTTKCSRKRGESAGLYIAYDIVEEVREKLEIYLNKIANQ